MIASGLLGDNISDRGSRVAMGRFRCKELRHWQQARSYCDNDQAQQEQYRLERFLLCGATEVRIWDKEGTSPPAWATCPLTDRLAETSRQ